MFGTDKTHDFVEAVWNLTMRDFDVNKDEYHSRSWGSIRHELPAHNEDVALCWVPRADPRYRSELAFAGRRKKVQGKDQCRVPLEEVLDHKFRARVRTRLSDLHQRLSMQVYHIFGSNMQATQAMQQVFPDMKYLLWSNRGPFSAQEVAVTWQNSLDVLLPPKLRVSVPSGLLEFQMEFLKGTELLVFSTVLGDDLRLPDARDDDEDADASSAFLCRRFGRELPYAPLVDRIREGQHEYVFSDVTQKFHPLPVDEEGAGDMLPKSAGRHEPIEDDQADKLSFYAPYGKLYLLLVWTTVRGWAEVDMFPSFAGMSRQGSSWTLEQCQKLLKQQFRSMCDADNQISAQCFFKPKCWDETPEDIRCKEVRS